MKSEVVLTLRVPFDLSRSISEQKTKSKQKSEQEGEGEQKNDEKGEQKTVGKQESKQKSEQKTDGKQESKQKTIDAIFMLIAQKPTITRSEIANSLALSDSAVYNNIQKLKSIGRIKRIGGDKGGHWEILE